MMQEKIKKFKIIALLDYEFVENNFISWLKNINLINVKKVNFTFLYFPQQIKKNKAIMHSLVTFYEIDEQTKHISKIKKNMLEKNIQKFFFNINMFTIEYKLINERLPDSIFNYHPQQISNFYNLPLEKKNKIKEFILTLRCKKEEKKLKP